MKDNDTKLLEEAYTKINEADQEEDLQNVKYRVLTGIGRAGIRHPEILQDALDALNEFSQTKDFEKILQKAGPLPTFIDPEDSPKQLRHRVFRPIKFYRNRGLEKIEDWPKNIEELREFTTSFKNSQKTKVEPQIPTVHQDPSRGTPERRYYDATRGYGYGGSPYYGD